MRSDQYLPTYRMPDLPGLRPHRELHWQQVRPGQMLQGDHRVPERPLLPGAIYNFLRRGQDLLLSNTPQVGRAERFLLHCFQQCWGDLHDVVWGRRGVPEVGPVEPSQARDRMHAGKGNRRLWQRRGVQVRDLHQKIRFPISTDYIFAFRLRSFLLLVTWKSSRDDYLYVHFYLRN